MTDTSSRPSGPAGTIARAGGKDGPQIVASRGKRWTDEAEQLFLDHLAASCNYTRSAAHVGFSREAIYKRRRRDPAFAAACDSAIAQGRARIEALLVERAEQMLEGRQPDPDCPIPTMTVADAINVLKLHGPAARRGGRGPGWRGCPRSLEEVGASILRKLAAFERARAKG